MKTQPDQIIDPATDFRERMRGIMPLGQLMPDTDCDLKGDSSCLISDLVTDSRRVSPGSLFFAFSGSRVDGNSHIQEAVDRGAAGIVTGVDHVEHAGVASLRVSDARKALARFARSYHGWPDKTLRVSGITGTNGKTTVTALSRHLMERPGRPVGLVGTVKYHLGDREIPSFKTTPESADLYAMLRSMLAAGCSEAVMEVSSHGIHQSRVNGLSIEVAAFLNLSRDHLDYHGTMEDYFSEKRRIFNGHNGSLPKVAVINGDCPYGKRLLDEIPTQVRSITFGEAPQSDFRVRDISLSPEGTEFVLDCPEGSIVTRSPMLGRYNVMNIAASLAIVYAMGFSVSKVVHKVGTFNGVDGRMEPIERGQPYKVLVDYAHTPDALRNALGMLREFTQGKLHLVFGCGGDRDRGKRMEMTRVASAGADESWATSDNPRTEPQDDIFRDMRKGLPKRSKVNFVDDRRRAISLALDASDQDDCLLIAGKGHEAFQEVQYTSIPFDDRLVADELLNAKSLGL